MSVKLEAQLRPVSHGGFYVAVPDELAAEAGLKYASRVCGTVEGVPYRSSLARYSGVFHLGIPMASLREAGKTGGDVVALTLAPDLEPRPGDTIPDDLAAALDEADLRDAFEALAVGKQRELNKSVLSAKRAETRTRRIDKVLGSLE